MKGASFLAIAGLLLFVGVAQCVDVELVYDKTGDETVRVGRGTVILGCRYTINEVERLVSVVWSKEGRLLAFEPWNGDTLTAGEPYESTYDVSSVQVKDAGFYTCNVTTTAESDSDSYELIVYEQDGDYSEDYVRPRGDLCEADLYYYAPPTNPNSTVFCGVYNPSTFTWLQPPGTVLSGNESQYSYSSERGDFDVVENAAGWIGYNLTDGLISLDEVGYNDEFQCIRTLPKDDGSPAIVEQKGELLYINTFFVTDYRKACSPDELDAYATTSVPVTYSDDARTTCKGDLAAPQGRNLKAVFECSTTFSTFNMECNSNQWEEDTPTGYDPDYQTRLEAFISSC